MVVAKTRGAGSCTVDCLGALKTQVWKTQVQVERLENVGTARTANANLVYNSRRIYKQPGSWLLGSTLHVSSRGAKNSMNTPVLYIVDVTRTVCALF